MFRLITGPLPGRFSASIAEKLILKLSFHPYAMKMFTMVPGILITDKMEIGEDVIKRALNAMLWVLEPYLEESILDYPCPNDFGQAGAPD